MNIVVVVVVWIVWGNGVFGSDLGYISSIKARGKSESERGMKKGTKQEEGELDHKK